MDSSGNELIDLIKNVVTDQAALAKLDELITRYDNNEVRQSLYERKALDLAYQEVRRNRTKPDKPLQGNDLKIFQELAKAYYQDSDLPTPYKLQRAFEILSEAGPLAQTDVLETLGLAGAIYKRWWQFEGAKQHLEIALAYYFKGHLQGREQLQARRAAGADIRLLSEMLRAWCYPAINAAFVLDLLAADEERQAKQTGFPSSLAKERSAQAAKIRRELAEALREQEQQNDDFAHEWWVVATIAECYFGLGDYAQAQPWLARARALMQTNPSVTDRQVESTVRQLAHLARLQTETLTTTGDAEPWQVLRESFDLPKAALQALVQGKLGLALSGGGFRAAFFHLGVLARLAELDQLRHIEAISCVSGGSIVGAYYYLKLKHTLSTVPDGEIKAECYQRLVAEMISEFLSGVQQNIRTRLFLEPRLTWRAFFSSDDTLTRHLGDLYERMLYRQIKDGAEDNPRYLHELLIKPCGWTGTDSFHPPTHNWRRGAKVPTLVLNAATLNTGHCWQFTARYMGVPPASIEREVDSLARFRRVYFYESSEPADQVRLGHAVAASSSVPGIFYPLSLPQLYPDRTVELVDGGVHDNQGTASLLEQGCTALIVSDACGQLTEETQPKRWFFPVLKRTNDILMERVRLAQFRELDALRRAGRLQRLIFVHLRKGLDPAAINWLRNKEHALPQQGAEPETAYGVSKRIQQLLSLIRTDLDAFCNAEAYALMTSGYLMVSREFEQVFPNLAHLTTMAKTWDFPASLPEPSSNPALNNGFLQLLEIAQESGFKIWKIPPLSEILRTRWRQTKFALAGLLTVMLGLAGYVSVPLLGLLGLGLVTIILAWWARGLAGRTFIVITACLVACFAHLHLKYFNQRYLNLGANLAKETTSSDKSSNQTFTQQQ